MQETLIDKTELLWQSDAYHELGALFLEQSRLKEVENMYLQALAGKEKSRGTEHTSTLETVSNLGIIYRNQGKLKESEDMYLRALAGYEKIWDAEHTSTLKTVNNLGALYWDQGKILEKAQS